jgi:hypothetical protein
VNHRQCERHERRPERQPPRSDVARRDRHRAGEGEGASDQQRDPERGVDAAQQRVVGALGEPRVLAPLLRVAGEARRLCIERTAQPRTRVDGVDVGDERTGELELVDRRQPRVEHQRRALLAHVGDGVVELRRGDGRQDHQRDRYPGVPDRQQAGRLPGRPLREQLAGERRQRHPHAQAGEDLRQDDPSG